MSGKKRSVGLAFLGLMVLGMPSAWADPGFSKTEQTTQEVARMESMAQGDSAGIIQTSTQKTQQGMTPPPAATKNEATQASKNKVRQLTGEIEAVTAKQLQLKKGQQSYTLNITEKTKVKVGGAEKQISELKVGDKVTTKYTEENGVMMARSVHLKTDSVK